MKAVWVIDYDYRKDKCYNAPGISMLGLRLTQYITKKLKNVLIVKRLNIIFLII